MDSLAKLKEQLEYLFIRIIIAGLKGGSMPIPEAKALANDFLKMEPFANIDDARNKVNEFVSKNPKFTLLKEYADVFYDEDKIEDKLATIRQHLKENNIDQAISTIKP